MATDDELVYQEILEAEFQVYMSIYGRIREQKIAI